MCFRCIIVLSYRGTFFLNVIVQIHYTPESPVRFIFLKKVVKWCNITLCTFQVLFLNFLLNPSLYLPFSSPIHIPLNHIIIRLVLIILFIHIHQFYRFFVKMLQLLIYRSACFTQFIVI